MLLHAVRTQLAAVNPEQQTYNQVEDLDSWVFRSDGMAAGTPYGVDL